MLNGAGYAVYAPDHRGHGRTARDDADLGWAGADGWNGMVRDLAKLADIVRSEQPPPSPLSAAPVRRCYGAQPLQRTRIRY